jgi:hypothetical protein
MASKTIVTEAQLNAAFLAARAHGKILADEVLRDIILAARGVKVPRERPMVDRSELPNYSERNLEEET